MHADAGARPAALADDGDVDGTSGPREDRVLLERGAVADVRDGTAPPTGNARDKRIRMDNLNHARIHRGLLSFFLTVSNKLNSPFRILGLLRLFARARSHRATMHARAPRRQAVSRGRHTP
jgi:hypothetical protein